ncbi:MAG: hypothetical protein IJK66_04880 [Bacilli bacterium]|nr:hypothetical protein [Bacilli bacterium]
MIETKSDRNRILITVMLVVSFLVLLPCVYFTYKFYSLSKTSYVKLSENSSLDYKVCLKKNDFYEDKCVESGNQYVASLIDYIPANIDYKLDFLGKDVDFKYQYKVVALFNVIDKDNKRALFTKKETLYESEEISANNNANISYDLDINYNKYNDLLSDFVTIYDLEETINTLKIYLNVDISGDGNTSMENINKDSVVSLSIPLTRKTVDVDIKSVESINDTDVLIKSAENSMLYLFSAGVCLLIFLILIIYVIWYYKSTRTILEIYQKRIKKITSTYDSYIQRINGSYPIGASQICKVVSFRDMLEIKDTSDKPLLMLENEAKTGTFFIIPVGEGVIYTYALRVEDIMAEKDGTTAPDYDIEDMNIIKPEEKKKTRKYTKEKIKEDIEKTTSIGIIDDKNAIKGTKNSDESLYDQLEKTAVFKAIKDNYYFPDTKIKRKKTTTKKKKTK